MKLEDVLLTDKEEIQCRQGIAHNGLLDIEKLKQAQCLKLLDVLKTQDNYYKIDGNLVVKKNVLKEIEKLLKE